VLVSGVCFASKVDPLKKADAAFVAGNFEKSVVLYRILYKKNNKSIYIRQKLAASLYHLGLTNKSLELFNSTPLVKGQRSFNFLYQGMNYFSLNKFAQARKFYLAAAAINDRYGHQALFELAVLFSTNKNRERTQYWLDSYLRKALQGSFRKKAKISLKILQQGKQIKLTGLKKPNLETALFKYNKLSLMKRSHFWLIKGGYRVEQGTAKDPEQEGKVKTVPRENQLVDLEAAIGIGPVKTKDAQAVAGYAYIQNWLTDSTRLAEWFSDLTRLDYLPFQLDLLSRSHQIFGDYRRQLPKNFFMGVYGLYNYKTLGSRIGSDELLSEVLSLHESTLFVPFIGLSMQKHFNTIIYAFLKQEINFESPTYSYKSFSLFGDASAISVGLTQTFAFPKARLDGSFEVFRYEYIYNNYWLDFSRLGGLLKLRYGFYKKFFLQGYFGMYSDAFQVPILRVKGCKFPADELADTTKPARCQRNDSGTLWQLGAYYSHGGNLRFDFFYTNISDSSANLIIYDRSLRRFSGAITWSFPAVERTNRYVDRFSEQIFRKEAD
jgi:hypothetical protein